MADLFFKVNADYQQLDTMLGKLKELEHVVADFSGTKEELAGLTSEMGKIRDTISDIAGKAAKDYVNAFTSMDSYSPQFMKSLSSEAQTFSLNMAMYFRDVQSKYEAMLRQLNEGGNALSSIKIADGAEAGVVDNVRKSVEELKGALSDCIKTCELQSQVWQGMYDGKVSSDAITKAQELAGAEQGVIDKSREQAAAEQEARQRASASLDELIEKTKEGEAEDSRYQQGIIDTTKSIIEAKQELIRQQQHMNELFRDDEKLGAGNQNINQGLANADAAIGSANLDKMKQSLEEINRLAMATKQVNDDGQRQYVQRIVALDEIISKERERLQLIEQERNQSSKSPAADVAALNQQYDAQRQKIGELAAQREAYTAVLDDNGNKMLETARATAAASAADDEERQRYVEGLKNGEVAMADFTSGAKLVTQALGEQSAAAKQLNLDDLKGNYQTATANLEEVNAKLEDANQRLIAAQNEFSRVQRAYASGDKSVSANDVTNAEVEVDRQKQAVIGLAKEYNAVNSEVQMYKQQLDEASGHQVRIRTQIMNAREELVSMIAAGQQTTPQFQQAAMAAGALRKQMALANAHMKYWATPNRNLAAAKVGLQGVAGAAGLVNGVLGLVNDKSEKMVEIQTRVQSIMAVIVGLETVYNAVKKTSLFYIAAQNAALAVQNAVKTVWIAITEGATAAQIAWNASMVANPYGAVIAAVVALAAAIYGVVKALSSASSEADMAKSALDAMGSSFDSQGKTVAEQITLFSRLEDTYNKNKNNAKALKKEIIDNTEAQNKLGITVKTVDDVHRIFGNHTTDYIRASIARMKATAAEAAQAELLGKTMSELSKVFAKVSAGKEVNWTDVKDILKDAGISDKEAERLMKYRGRFVESTEIFGKNNLTQVSQNGISDFMAGVVEEVQNTSVFKSLRHLAQSARNEESDAKASYSDLLKKNTPKSKTGTGKTRTSKTGTKKTDNYDPAEAANHRAELLENFTKKVQAAAEGAEKAITDSTIEFMNEGTEKELAKIKEDTASKLKAIDKQKKDIIDAYRDYLLQAYLTQKGAKKGDAKYKTLKESDDNTIWETLKKVAPQIDGLIAKRRKWVQAEGLKAIFTLNEKTMDEALKSYEQFYDKRLAIHRKYNEQRRKLDEHHSKGLVDDNSYNQLKSSINAAEDNELSKMDLASFKNSPLYQSAMSGDLFEPDAIEKVFEKMKGHIAAAAETMEPADFKTFMEAFQGVSDKLIKANPFDALRKSAEELKKAEGELTTAHQHTQDIYAQYGLDEFGQDTGTGQMSNLKKAADDAQDELAAAQKGYDDVLRDNPTDTKKVEAAQQRLTEARKNSSKAALDLTKATTEVAAAERREGNVILRVNSAKSKNKKATQEVLQVTRQWAEAVKTAAGMFQSPIATAIASMAGLTVTTIDSIKAIEDAGKSSAKGVEKVAMAVTKAVAILAVIQAAWQVINTIMGLFSGREEKKYEEKVSSLRGQINALDYAFNNLKEDMDKTWGTEAIDNYSKAVDQLNSKQAKQLELIRMQAGAHIGHHSLSYYFDKKSGLTDSDWQQAYQWAKQQGYDISGTKTDFLYNMTPEQLKDFMSSGIGSYIMGALGGVKGTGDYSGSDWYSDMQAYADTAKDVENLTDDLQAKLNGISFDALKDNLKDLVTTFGTSLNDINNDFDKIMREATYNNVRTGYENSLKDWYKELDELNKKRAEGMSADDYRKQLALLKEKYGNIVKNAQNEYQETLTEAGINVKNVEQSATSGGFETMSEDTGTELNGRFAAMQAQETITAENSAKLVTLTGGVYNIADEIRTIQVNSYLELKAITENTGKVVGPIMEMQENIKKIKDNTDSL